MCFFVCLFVWCVCGRRWAWRLTPPPSWSFPPFYLGLFILFFLEPHLQDMKVPRLGIKLELQLPAYTTAHGSARSLTHQGGPGIEPTSSWILVRFVAAEPWWERPVSFIFKGTAITFIYNMTCILFLLYYISLCSIFYVSLLPFMSISMSVSL